MDGVSIHPVTTKIKASFLTQLPERKETSQGFHHEANGDFKTVTELNGCDRRKLKPVQNKNILKPASCLQQGTKVIIQKMWQSNPTYY